MNATEIRDLERFGELPSSLLDRIAEDAERNELTVRTYLASAGHWGRTLMFASRVEQALAISRRLRQERVPTVVITGEDSPLDRRLALKSFEDGKAHVLVNVLVAAEGTDLPSVESVFLVRPTRSQVLFQQMIGRGMRGPRVGGTEYCRIVSFRDHIIGMVEHQLTHRYTWEAQQIQSLGFEEGYNDSTTASFIDTTNSSQEKTQENHKDDEECAKHKKLAQELMEAHTELLRHLDLGTAMQKTELKGWWSLPVNKTLLPKWRAYALPIFHDDDAFHNSIAQLAQSISRGEPSPSAEGHVYSRWLNSGLVSSFRRRAIDSKMEPVYSELLTNESAKDFINELESWTSKSDMPDRLIAYFERISESRRAIAEKKQKAPSIRHLFQSNSSAFALLDIKIPSDGLILEGWWSLWANAAHGRARAYPLPIFHGDDELSKFIRSLSVQIDAERSEIHVYPKSEILRPWLIDRFLLLLNQSSAAPAYRSYENSDDTTFTRELGTWIRDDSVHAKLIARLDALERAYLERCKTSVRLPPLEQEYKELLKLLRDAGGDSWEREKQLKQRGTTALTGVEHEQTRRGYRRR
jgi:superfamily II DNA/RNA helicase